MELNHLSYSSISSYLNCGRNWKYKYLDKVPTAKNGEMFFGSVFHNTIEFYIQSKSIMEKAATEQLLDYWKIHWKNELEKEQISWGDNSPENLFNEGIRILSNKEVLNTLNSIKPLIEPDGPVIEKKIELRVPGVPIPIIGYIDMIAQDGIPVDFKTSSRSWDLKKAQAEMQPTFYLAALNQLGYKNNPQSLFRHYIFVKTKTPQVQVWETRRSLQEIFWLFQLIREVWEGIQKEVYTPNPQTYICDPKYCAYWKGCRGNNGTST